LRLGRSAGACSEGQARAARRYALDYAACLHQQARRDDPADRSTRYSVKPELISTAILVVHWLIVIGLSIRVIMRRLPVGISLAWLTVVFSVPFGGAALYVLFGEKRLGKRRRLRLSDNVERRTEWLESVRAAWPDSTGCGGRFRDLLFRQAEHVTGFPALPGNELELLTGPDRFLDRLIADIDSARHSVHMAFYIWQRGGRVDAVADALIRATQRGVRCLALADAVGSKHFLRSEAFARLRQAGIEVVDSLPTNLLRMLFVRADLRNHRKIVVIDDVTAYAGSQNLVDPRFFKRDAGFGEWVDAMVRIRGPAVNVLDSVFGLDWAVETGAEFVAPPELRELSAPDVPDDALVQIVPSGPDVHQESIHWALLGAIYSASREIVLSTPYFVPDDSILKALLSAATRGVRVLLIVPARIDSLLVRYASVAHYDELMAAGVRIARFEGGLLHTKSVTVDREVSLFGSVNLDMRSFWLNFEISLIVYDHDFTEQLRELQESYLRSSTLLELEAWRRRPVRQVFVSNACRLIGPVI
jgi:cardiolipin synthase